MLPPPILLWLVAVAVPCTHAAITVYYQTPLGLATSTNTASAANYTGAAAYDPTVLKPPALPNPLPPNTFTVNLQSSAGAVPGLSIPQSGSFYGFSIEMSVITQVLGKNSTFINVPFLNLMANLVERGGRVNIRVGGNSQETANFTDSLPGGKILSKDTSTPSNPTQTPALLYTADVFYMLNNISSLVNVKWYLGIPFLQTTPFNLEIAEIGQAILGNNLIGLQGGNEPDLYAAHGHRPASYGPFDYFGEFGTLVQSINNDPNIPVKNMLLGPSLATGAWTPEQVWQTGFATSYGSSLAALTVEHYPDNNCFAQFGVGAPVDPQTEFPLYLNHSAGVNLVAPYLNSAGIAQSVGKPFLMFETNTASCGGFPGISDSYGAGLWALDYGFQMAYSNFSGALLHVGGQNVYYNPFTPPPTNQSGFHQWTIGAIYYSTLIVAEAFGPSNQSRILDLNANAGNGLTPGYVIYDDQGALSKVALFNYMTDPTGAAAYTASLSVAGGTTPSSVQVKYFSAPSVSEKYNITWAGQTFGTTFDSDGRLQGTLNVQTVQCTTTCPIYVPAPGFALVFFTSSGISEVDNRPQTYPTTALTKTHNTATIDPAVLATSNGHTGANRQVGDTSQGRFNGAIATAMLAGGLPMLAVAVSTVVLVMGWSV